MESSDRYTWEAPTDEHEKLSRTDLGSSHEQTRVALTNQEAPTKYTRQLSSPQEALADTQLCMMSMRVDVHSETQLLCVDVMQFVLAYVILLHAGNLRDICHC